MLKDWSAMVSSVIQRAEEKMRSDYPGKFTRAEAGTAGASLSR